jgi:hypothetical protein
MSPRELELQIELLRTRAAVERLELVHKLEQLRTSTQRAKDAATGAGSLLSGLFGGAPAVLIKLLAAVGSQPLLAVFAAPLLSLRRGRRALAWAVAAALVGAAILFREQRDGGQTKD